MAIVSRRQKGIPTILTSKELLDKAFKRASTIKKKGVDRLESTRRSALAKMTTSGDIISGTLESYVRAFPSFQKGEEFNIELIEVLIGLDELKKSLAALDWCAKKSSDLERVYLDRVRKAVNVAGVHQGRKEFYGRLSSLVDQIGKDLKFVSEARWKLKKLPIVDLSLPTVVIAGYPNVGKSQLVERMSTAKPLIAPYPFTTKGIGVGHFKEGWRTYQVIDTPGLLDRPLEERNRIERQAILALKYLADVIVFILDPSESSGYRLEDQLALLESVKKGFEGLPIIEIENKVDMVRTDSGRLKVSALTGKGVQDLIGRVVSILRTTEKEAGRVFR
ncbi:MAG: 50S ribosome-binding GTPase [Methanomassiliicoccales archaeon]|nr:50S ribosome-binding GTPase [Methanomassiliicoccales archaeon]